VRPGIARTWILHHDNAPYHTAECLAEKNHFFGSSAPLFAGSKSLWLTFIPPSQKPLERAPFSTLDNIQKSVTDELKGLPGEAIQHCYEQWKQRLRSCVAAQGNYFKGNNLDL